MRNFIDILNEDESEEETLNPVKQQLAQELSKIDAKDVSKHNVPGFRQRGHHLTLGNSAKGWAKSWRRDAINDLPDNVASVKKVVATPKLRNPRSFEFLIFFDQSGNQLLAVQPRYSNSIHKYEVIPTGETLDTVLGDQWKVRY